MRLPADYLGRTPWAIWDRHLDLWVAAAGELELYFDRPGATACIRRLRYLHEAGLLHP